MSGDIYHNLYPKLGRIVRELNTGTTNEIASADQYGDKRKLDIVKNEKNITLFLSTHVYNVEKTGNRIAAVLAKNVENNQELRFISPLLPIVPEMQLSALLQELTIEVVEKVFLSTKEPKAPQTSEAV